MNRYPILHGVNDLRMESHPIPALGPNEVLLRMSKVGLCGSDLSLMYKGKLGDYTMVPPLGVGHEASGVVTKCGSAVTSLKPGDRVAVEPGDPCGKCEFCRSGHYNNCVTAGFHSSPVPNPGCLALYFVHRADFCFKLPDNVTQEEGALIEPFAVAIHACRRARITAGTTVLVCGAGPLGLLSLLAARAMGATSILVTDVRPERLETARKMGANYTMLAGSADPQKEAKRIEELMGCMPEVTLECTGVEIAFQTAIYATRSCGAVLMVGLPSADLKLPIVHASLREVDILGVFRYLNCYPIAIDLISKGVVDVKPLITHRFKFDEFQKAFEFFRNGTDGAIKCMISCD
ncbi:sorbitol dehydrogenase-like [Penaeus chinensis]|uniref:sorbitol dehydrogenase-like n=1 Tax=Penaeus chinensis TaxID=139456 RepID=UPI001FB6090F|nr:sorbitol dehydrogenase-like [Penaeus chinensis]